MILSPTTVHSYTPTFTPFMSVLIYSFPGHLLSTTWQQVHWIFVLFWLKVCLECNDNKTNKNVDHEESNDDEIDEVIEEYDRSIILFRSCRSYQQLNSDKLRFSTPYIFATQYLWFPPSGCTDIKFIKIIWKRIIFLLMSCLYQPHWSLSTRTKF